MKLSQDPRFSAGDGLPAWPPRTGEAQPNGKRPALATATTCASGATLDDVQIVRPYTISRHLMLTVSNRDSSWRVPLRLDQPGHIPALHDLLVANIGRTIAEIGELELHPSPAPLPTTLLVGALRSRRHEESLTGYLE